MYTRSGWLDILENLYTARIVLGVLTGNNANVFYELGIAHATQKIERQLLIAEKGYKARFDLKDLIYFKYDPQNLNDSVGELASAINDTMDVYDINADRMVSIAESRLSFYEFDVMLRYGGKSPNFILPKDANPNDYDGAAHLCHAGLLRLSTKLGNGKIEYSYYWTDLGNAVLHRLGVIKEESMKDRMTTYRKIFTV